MKGNTLHITFLGMYFVTGYILKVTFPTLPLRQPHTGPTARFASVNEVGLFILADSNTDMGGTHLRDYSRRRTFRACARCNVSKTTGGANLYCWPKNTKTGSSRSSPDLLRSILHHGDELLHELFDPHYSINQNNAKQCVERVCRHRLRLHCLSGIYVYYPHFRDSLIR